MIKPKRGKVRIFDNGGETFDRYTCFFLQEYLDCSGRSFWYYLAMSENPSHPQGFGQHGDSRTSPPKRSCHLGKIVAFETLPAEVQKCIIADLSPNDLTQ